MNNETVVGSKEVSRLAAGVWEWRSVQMRAPYGAGRPPSAGLTLNSVRPDACCMARAGRGGKHLVRKI